nr:MAG: DUF1150 family protein [Hyphomicrobiales bacterium]
MNARTTFDNGETMGFDTKNFEGSRLAYIKPIGVGEARALGAIPSDIVLPEGVQLYAIHAADGSPVAIMDTWAAAYGTALQHNLTPLSVH